MSNGNDMIGMSERDMLFQDVKLLCNRILNTSFGDLTQEKFDCISKLASEVGNHPDIFNSYIYGDSEGVMDDFKPVDKKYAQVIAHLHAEAGKIEPDAMKMMADGRCHKYIIVIDGVKSTRYKYNIWSVFEYKDGSVSQDTRIFKSNDVAEFVEFVSSKPVDKKYAQVIAHLHAEAGKIEPDAMKMMADGQCHAAYQRLELSRSLRIAANYLDGVQGA